MDSSERIKKALDCAEDRIYSSLWEIAFYELHNRYESFPNADNEVLNFFASPRLKTVTQNLSDTLCAIQRVRQLLGIPKYTPVNMKPDIFEKFRADFWQSVMQVAHEKGTETMPYLYSIVAEGLKSDGIEIDSSPIMVGGLLSPKKSNNPLY